MANVLNENDDDLIPVETPIEDDQQDAAPVEGDDDDDHDEDEGDERLAESEDDHDEEVSLNRKRRQKRREMQKRAREATQQELNALRANNEEMARRLAAVEGHAINSNAQQLDARLNQTLNDIRQAEMIMAKATEAGNGEDVVAAMRIRDAAMSEAQQLQHQKQQFEQARQPRQPQVDPNVVGYARQWMEANPWYDPNGSDRDSALTKVIDNELAREGYNPGTRAYWEELTNRVAEALGEAEPAQSKPRRKAPPQGNTREHAPTSSRKEIYVTPERKQAMIDAGVWDDPVARQRYLKAYQAYDNGSAR
jgi:hypothetical protein